MRGLRQIKVITPKMTEDGTLCVIARRILEFAGSDVILEEA